MRTMLIGAIAAVAIFCCTTIARADSRGTASSASETIFNDTVKADVAKGYYTQAQADELMRQADTTLARINESSKRAANRLDKTVAIAMSGNLRDVASQVGVFSNRNGGLAMGGTESEVREQATAIYNTIDALIQTRIAVEDDVSMLLIETASEFDYIISARAALIEASPNASARDKAKERSDAAKMSDIFRNRFARWMQEKVYKLETARDQYQSRRDVLIAEISGTIRANTAQYGPDPKNWPKPTPSRSSSAAHGGPGLSSRSSGNAATQPGNGTRGSGDQQTAGRTVSAGSTNGTGYGAGTPGGPKNDGTDEQAEYFIETKDNGNGTVTETSYLPGRVGDGYGPVYKSRTYQSQETPTGYNNLTSSGLDTPGGSPTTTQLSAMLPPHISLPEQSGGPYTDGDLNGASFATVYRGYVVRPDNTGSTVILVPSTQVNQPTSLMTAPSNQVQVPSGMIDMPSTQITMPGNQINVPSTQVQTPGSAGNSLDLQPALCGR